MIDDYLLSGHCFLSQLDCLVAANGSKLKAKQLQLTFLVTVVSKQSLIYYI